MRNLRSSSSWSAYFSFIFFAFPLRPRTGATGACCEDNNLVSTESYIVLRHIMLYLLFGLGFAVGFLRFRLWRACPTAIRSLSAFLHLAPFLCTQEFLSLQKLIDIWSLIARECIKLTVPVSALFD